jgi:hypothetical protein
MTKFDLAGYLNTSRSQIDRILDPAVPKFEKAKAELKKIPDRLN